MNTFMQKLGVLTAMLSAFLSVFAYDFEADGICYNITDPTAKEVEVTYGSYGEFYSGDIVVPPSVSYHGDLYSVTSIGFMAFSDCSSLTAITIPNSVIAIGNGAFYYCSSLTAITVPNSVTSIGYWAFLNCSSLSSITIPNSVTSIGDEAFYRCSSLTSITIPNSVTSIGDEAFFGCSSLSSITIPNSVTSIGYRAFADCSSLTSISLPNSVTTIETSAFADCSSLASINIPNSVTSIGYWAFRSCSSLTSITIPNSVTSIGLGTFYDCSSLTSITSLAITPPGCGHSVFYGVDKQKCTLYVPAESVEAYKQANGWKDFVLVEAVEAGIDSVAAGSADGATEVFNLTGAKVADSLENLPAGIYLVREGSTIRKIAVR